VAPQAVRAPDALSESDAALLAGRRVIVVMPAYNAARTLRESWQLIPRAMDFEGHSG
jgi:hypothetical protein